jgi:Xaa-Pro aminopeptidase
MGRDIVKDKQPLGNGKGINDVLRAHKVDVLTASSIENLRYLADASFEAQRYIKERIGVCVWPVDGEPTLIARNTELTRLKTETWIKDTRPYVEMGPQGKTPIQVMVEVIRERGLERSTIAVEKSFLVVRYYDELMKLLPDAKIIDSTPLLDEMKQIKTPVELERIRYAGKVTERAAAIAFRATRAGDREIDLVARMKYELTRLGAESVPFVIMGAGGHCSENHPIANDTPLLEGDPLRVDFGGIFQGYMSDVARMATVGTPTNKDRDAFAKLTTVQDEGIDMLRPGVAACEVFEHVKRRMTELEIPIDKDFVGHSIGTAVHELPWLAGHDRTILQPNMVFAIEPSHTQRGIVRYHIEDFVIVTEGAPERVTDLFDMERLFEIE